MRHQFAVRCPQCGVPIAVVSSELGHTSMERIINTYGRWSLEARNQCDGIKKLDRPADAVARGARLEVV